MHSPTLIETVRVRAGVTPLLHLHVRRLSESCLALGVPFPTELEWPKDTGRDHVHRWEVGVTGVSTTTRDVGSAAPVTLVTAKVAHRPYPHKTTQREVFDAALAEARSANADDAVLLTSRGEVAECAIWSLLWWEGSHLAGPAASLGVLRSVARMRLAELTGEITERVLRRSELAGRALVVANAVRGLVPVAELDGREVPQRPETPHLAERFWS